MHICTLHELTTLLNNQAQQFSQQTTATQPIQPTTSATSKIAKPDPFDDSPEKLDVFLPELYLNFEDDITYFNVDHMQKIHFALSYMKLKFAAQWAR